MTIEILMVTSEVYPLAKTGGLGDAVSGLVRAVHSESTPVTVMMPGWRDTRENLHNIQYVAAFDDLPGGPATLIAGHSKSLGVRILLLCNDALFNRDSLYVDADGKEYGDNAVRFAALSMAAARLAHGVAPRFKPSVLHVHDWHAALVPLFMHQLGVRDVKTVLTLHNVAFQGVYPLSMAPDLGIQQSYCTPDGLEFWGQLNFLKAGIRFADQVTVVSHNYAREIMTPRYGCGLEGTLASRAEGVIAIPNGIDTSVWNPNHDVYLGDRTFNPERMENKTRCKYKLQAQYGLPRISGSFLLAMGSRLTEQKMADVAAQALPLALEKYPMLQLCIMGKGDKQAETALQALATRYPGRCGVHIGYSEARAHLLHAGADALLHGSRFEPFGLTPLYAMRYGTIPIGSRVGGMVDTIVDPGQELVSRDLRKATGILFDGETASDMLQAIDRTLALHTLPFVWRAMQRNAMTAPMGWEQTAPLYIQTYQALCTGLVVRTIPERTVSGVEGPGLSSGKYAVRSRAIVKSPGGNTRLPSRTVPAVSVDTVVSTGASVA